MLKQIVHLHISIFVQGLFATNHLIGIYVIINFIVERLIRLGYFFSYISLFVAHMIK